MTDELENKMGAILEQLATRFDLVLEAVTGFGGRLDALRTEMMSQFTEVGRQVRFLSDRIAENRESATVMRADLSAEMIRLGESLGATRVDFREQLAAIRSDLHDQAAGAADRTRTSVAEELARASAEIRAQLGQDLAAARNQLENDIPAATAQIRAGISSSADAVVKKLDTELKQTSKALASLTRKFERFDDRITVQTKDQDQRLRKLERGAAR